MTVQAGIRMEFLPVLIEMLLAGSHPGLLVRFVSQAASKICYSTVAYLFLN